MNLSARSMLKMAAALATVTIGACTSYAPSKHFIGLSHSDTITALGKPNPMPPDVESAKRLDFPRGPFGKHTYSVYFDDQGKVSGYQQLLTEENFAKIVPGMAESEVVDVIGVSKDRFMLARDRGYVWNYRYFSPLCRWLQIEFTLEGKVRSTGYSKPPECRVGGRAFR